jgi:hypothetical protein
MVDLLVNMRLRAERARKMFGDEASFRILSGLLHELLEGGFIVKTVGDAGSTYSVKMRMPSEDG